jgi:hypothetical protein
LVGAGPAHAGLPCAAGGRLRPGGQRRDSALHAVRRSLRTTVYAADQHKLATGSYANFMAPPGFAGVTIYISDVSARGFQARATHRRYTRDELECRVGIGPATPLGLAEGEPGGPQCR